MKIIVNKQELNTHLSVISRIVPSRPSHPVLGNILISAKEETGQVTLTAFDLSLGAVTKFKAEVREGGEATLHARLFTEIVSRSPDGEITISVEENDEPEKQTPAYIKTASAQFQISTLPATDFPEIPKISGGEVIKLPVEVLREGIKSVLFAASGDETKQVLTGIHLIKKLDHLEFASTDGHRLAVAQTSIGENEDCGKDISITIPSRTLGELDRILSSQKTGHIFLEADNSQVAFTIADSLTLDNQDCCVLFGRKLEGSYPSYEQLIPKSFERSLVLDRKQLIRCLEMVSVLNDAKSNLVKLFIDPEDNQLFLSVESPDLGSAKESMPAEMVQGEKLELALSAKYLLEGIKVLSSKDIKVELNNSTHPVIFTPLSGIKVTYLVMPVQIRK